jgi:hypothetical protein
MVAQLWKQYHCIINGVRPLLKAALVEVGPRLMASPRTGPLLTWVVQQSVTRVVRRWRLADA